MNYIALHLDWCGVFCFISGTYGRLVAYSANNKKSLSQIYLPQLEDDTKNSKGYMGHDEFTVILRTAWPDVSPYTRKVTSNAKPTGGIRQLQYKLVAGEATWQLKLVKSTSF